MLQEYWRKRDLTKTPEPRGQVRKAARARRLEFVVQKHSARRLHFDFRLELDGVLLSWAVPKGPSLNPSERHLAIHVEDHPFEYRKFEGIIPSGQYGAGEVIVWDKGTYEPEGGEGESRKVQMNMVRRAVEQGKLTIRLSGEKLNGLFTLIRLSRQNQERQEQWLLIKKHDQFADTDPQSASRIQDDDTSVQSSKTLVDLQRESGKIIELARRRQKRERRPLKRTDISTGKASRNRSSKRMKQEKPPSRLQPMLAKLVDAPFSSSGWIFEPKLDGIRALAYIDMGSVKLLSRRGLDLTERYPRLAETLAHQADMILDGEIVALDENGRPSFQLLQQRSGLSARPDVARADWQIPIVYYIFDILYADGKTVMNLPLHERRKILQTIFKEDELIKIVRDLGPDGIKAFEACKQYGLEGIVAKRVDSQYQAGQRSGAWLKVKANKTSEFLICGYMPGAGARSDTFGSLILGFYDQDGKLKYAGRVGTGFDEKLLHSLKRLMQPLKVKKSPFDRRIPEASRAVWLKPLLVAEIKFGEWTRDGILRAPVFLHLRDDVEPETVSRPAQLRAEAMSSALSVKAVESADESPAFASSNPSLSLSVPGRDKTGASRGQDEEDRTISGARLEKLLQEIDNSKNELILDVEGHSLKFSNLNKVLWPPVQKVPALSKRDYLAYLIKVSPYILPHLKDRPLTLIRFPNGITGQKFFQKHWEKNMPAFMTTVDYFSEHNNSDETYLICNSLAALLWLAQIADLEIHVTHTRVVKDADTRHLADEFTGSLEQVHNSVLNYPDYIVIDLDPYLYSGKEASGAEPELHKKGFNKTCEVALLVKDMLDQLGIRSYLKTSGRTGLHIYIPIVRNIDYDSVREIARTLGQYVLKARPDDVTMTWAVKGRTGKIFFDHNMNARYKTLPSPYSARVAPEASVSMPIDWSEIAGAIDKNGELVYPTDFTINNVYERLSKKGDLWKDILLSKNDLSSLLKK